MSAALELTLELMRRASLSPDDQGCLDVIGERLAAIGFVNERLPFGNRGAKSLTFPMPLRGIVSM